MDITIQQLNSMNPGEYAFIDTRDEISYQHGHIPGAILWNGTGNIKDKIPMDKKLVVYCSHGEKSATIVRELALKGMEAYNLQGGYNKWLLQDFNEISKDEIKRYNRQMILPQIGSDGQKKLKKSSVLIAGAGGLGSPAALYLASAGVGTIGIIDADTVSISNLQRQIIHNMETENMNKAESARIAMQKLNDRITINTYPYMFTEENADRLVKKYDFIIDATDNFETKFLINDTCVLNKKPFCYAGILQFKGQVMTYVPGKNPCYRCIFEEIPENFTSSCALSGIIGAVAGITGSIQALEAIKYLTGTGDLLTGRIFILDGLSMKTRIAKFKNKNPYCKICKKLKEKAEQL